MTTVTAKHRIKILVSRNSSFTKFHIYFETVRTDVLPLFYCTVAF